MACVDETAENVKRLSAARDSASDSERADAVRELRQEQTKVCIVKNSIYYMSDMYM